MKISVKLTNTGSTVINQVMHEEALAEFEHSDGSIEYFFNSCSDAKKALEKVCENWLPKNRAYYLPGVTYKWTKIYKKNVEESDLLQMVYSI